MTTVRIGFILKTICPDMPTGSMRALKSLSIWERTEVSLADREDAIQPWNAKRADIRKVLYAAAEHFDVLVSAWEEMHQ